MDCWLEMDVYELDLGWIVDIMITMDLENVINTEEMLPELS